MTSSRSDLSRAIAASRAMSISTVMGLLAICLATCASAGAATPSHLHRLVLRLPRTATGTGGGAHVRPVVGSATLEVPAGWTRGGLTHAGTVEELTVAVSPSCKASVEVSTGVGRLKGSPVDEIEGAMDSWYSALEEPSPVPLVTAGIPAQGSGALNRLTDHVWQLDAPKAPSSPAAQSPSKSPLYGVLLAHLHPGSLWASLMVNVETTSGCPSPLPISSSSLVAPELEAVKQELETIMLKALFKVTAGGGLRPTA
jgi:hypothetical protein